MLMSHSSNPSQSPSESSQACSSRLHANCFVAGELISLEGGSLKYSRGSSRARFSGRYLQDGVKTTMEFSAVGDTMGVHRSDGASEGVPDSLCDERMMITAGMAVDTGEWVWRFKYIPTIHTRR